MFPLFMVFLAALAVGLAFAKFTIGAFVFIVGAALVTLKRVADKRREMQERARREQAEIEARMKAKLDAKKEAIRKRQLENTRPGFNHLDVVGVRKVKPYVPPQVDEDNDDTRPFVRKTVTPAVEKKRRDNTVPYSTVRPVTENDSFTDPLNRSFRT